MMHGAWRVGRHVATPSTQSAFWREEILAMIPRSWEAYQKAHVPARAAAGTGRTHIAPDRLSVLCSDAAGFAG